jgi:predicted DNA-binding ribbon-helix-helix protein
MREVPHSCLILRNIVVAGRRTSVRLEPAMWEALGEIAWRRQLSLNALATEIDGQRNASSLTAAIRVYIVGFYRNAAPDGAPLPVWQRPARNRNAQSSRRG